MVDHLLEDTATILQAKKPGSISGKRHRALHRDNNKNGKHRTCRGGQCGPGYLSRYSSSLLAGRSEVRISVCAMFTAPGHTELEIHTVSCKIGTGFLSRKLVGVKLTTHVHLVLRLRKSRVIHLFPLCTFVACSRIQFVYTGTP